MFIISGGKGTGKTRALLEKASAENGIVVCKDPDAMRERAHRYGIVGLEIISYGECNFEVHRKPFYIHDINQFITYTVGNVKGYTLNID